MTIKDFIYQFNLASTMTIKDRFEWTTILNNNVDKDIDYSNSISLYDFINSFNKLYQKFKSDQNGLFDLGIVGDMTLVRYYGSENGDYEKFVIHVDNFNDKRFADGSGILYLQRINDLYSCYITNGLLTYDEGLIKKYLQLIKK